MGYIGRITVGVCIPKVEGGNTKTFRFLYGICIIYYSCRAVDNCSRYMQPVFKTKPLPDMVKADMIMKMKRCERNKVETV